MTLPETVRVKLSSEEAGTVSITPVVVRDMSLRELIEMMLGITGKDPTRVHELLLRGTLVSGASRFRWTGWNADTGSIAALLATFPDSDPGRPFVAERCVRAVLLGPDCRIDLPREAASRRLLLRRKSFWDLLMDIVAELTPCYVEYSYKERADCYRAEISSTAATRIRESAGMVRYSTLEKQIRSAALGAVDLFVERARA
jgi:hypothetical protein